MAIEITGLPTSKLQNAADGPSTTRSGHHNENQGEKSDASATKIVDTVSFTETATQLQVIENQIADLPVVDTARIERLQGLLERGEYAIDAGHVADRLMLFESQL